jgi:hypothetical protein
MINLPSMGVLKTTPLGSDLDDLDHDPMVDPMVETSTMGSTMGSWSSYIYSLYS